MGACTPWPWGVAAGSRLEEPASSILRPQLLQKLTPPGGSLTKHLGNELREEGHEGRRGQLGVSQQPPVPWLCPPSSRAPGDMALTQLAQLP